MRVCGLSWATLKFRVTAIFLAAGMSGCGGGAVTTPPPPPDFTLSTSPSTLLVAVNGSCQVTITATPVNGFSGSVAVSMNSLPSGVTVSPSLPQRLGPGGLTLTLTASPSALVGNYSPLLTASQGGLQHSAAVQLSIANRAPLTLSVPSQSFSLSQASSTSMNIAVDAGVGVVDYMAQLQAVVPAGLIASFSTSTISPNQSVALSLTAGNTELIGPTSVVVEATRSTDGVEFSATVPVVVTPNPVITGSILEFPVPTTAAAPSAITQGPDVAMWFSEEAANQIGRIALDATISEFPVPTPNAGIGGMATGSDGNIYFTESKASQIGTYNLSTAQFTEWPTPIPAAGPGGIVSAPDGTLWVMGAAVDTVFHLTTQGTFLPSVTLNQGCYPHGPIIGSDGNLWFACILANQIVSITPQGAVNYYNLPNPASLPTILTNGSDGNIYFTEQVGRIGQFNLISASFTEWAVPTNNSVPYGISSVANNICFTERSASKIACMPTGGGTIVEYATPTPSATPAKMSLGPDGRLWFTEQSGNNIGQLN